MIPISGVYEVAVRVRDLAKAEAFYVGTLGLEVGLRDDRGMLFLRVGAGGKGGRGGSGGMVVLQREENDFPQQHFALAIAEADIDKAAEALRERGVEVQGPVVHDWMPAKSAYFSDPDGHQLELCAPL